LCTHYHPDHAGLAQAITQAGAQLLLIEQQRAAVPPHITLDTVVGLSPATSRSFLQQHHIDGEIVWTPGHSDDSVSLVLDTGIAFTGDLQPPLASDEPSQRVLAQSWRELQARGVKHVYPGHGAVFSLQSLLEQWCC
jgi:endoribonuclease LACTB2